MSRCQYGFERTACSCRPCTVSCEHVPGALCPDDLGPMAAFLGYDDVGAFALDHLLASDGVVITVAATGEKVTLRTLVPASNDHGGCKFLSDGRCEIHPVSPYGCAFIDAHQSDSEYAFRADALYRALYEDLQSDGPYIRTWRVLHSAGRTAPPLSVRQARLNAAMRSEKLI